MSQRVGMGTLLPSPPLVRKAQRLSTRPQHCLPGRTFQHTGGEGSPEEHEGRVRSTWLHTFEPSSHAQRLQQGWISASFFAPYQHDASAFDPAPCWLAELGVGWHIQAAKPKSMLGEGAGRAPPSGMQQGASMGEGTEGGGCPRFKESWDSAETGQVILAGMRAYKLKLNPSKTEMLLAAPPFPPVPPGLSLWARAKRLGCVSLPPSRPDPGSASLPACSSRPEPLGTCKALGLRLSPSLPPGPESASPPSQPGTCKGLGCVGGGRGGGVSVSPPLPAGAPGRVARAWAARGRGGGGGRASAGLPGRAAEGGTRRRRRRRRRRQEPCRNMGRPAAPAARPAPPTPPLRLLLRPPLLLLLVVAAASEPPPGPPNATDLHATPWQGGGRQQVTVGEEASSSSGQDQPASGRSSAGEAGNGSAARASSQAAGPKETPQPPPAALPRGRDAAAPSDDLAASSPYPGAGLPVRYFSGERDPENPQMGTTLCFGCLGGGDQLQDPLGGPHGPLEALASITSFALPAQESDGTRRLSERRELPGSASPLPESREEAGSGDQHPKASPSEGDGAERTAVPTALEFATETSSPMGQDLGYDADERDPLLGTVGVAVLPSPTLSGPIQTPDEAERVVEQDSAQKEEPLELWVDSSSNSPSEGAQGRTNLAWLQTEAPTRLAATPSVLDIQTSKPSSDPSASEIIDIDYYDLFDGESLGGAGPDSTKRKPSEDKGMSWSLHDLYDDFTPFDESDFYPTTSFYIDGDEEELDEPEDDEEEEDGGGGLARDLEDENDYRIPTPAMPKIQTVVQEAESTSRRYVIPPLQTFVVSGGSGVATPKPRPAESGRDQSLSGGGENGTDCRTGYVRHNNSCKSVCDIFPSYCHNGGQCYLVENLGAFCRCNTQDYIWHKGTRCESIITDFQVMCVAVGSAALVVLLLFMMTVFFAKKLYLLKTENNKLRKTKYRTPSELHNDNFSLSTIAEGSHPNVRKFCDTPCNLSPHARALAYYDNIICQDDPNAPLKLQDPLKSCLKEEESFNIQNSVSPKLDNGKGDPGDSEVNCLQNNLT
ncbi:chondroitin sulfate proteoglycan 5 [Heteronotia binoei]|uniref:chondroitin sulfate proteoglycan 5 n=1 Tax=Heteronotia binoei TaxID=13085 RepID=UPI00292D8719|nr:chondroitin sulfate proteoglycan 5 [Heteronotia binoei]